MDTQHVRDEDRDSAPAPAVDDESAAGAAEAPPRSSVVPGAGAARRVLGAWRRLPRFARDVLTLLACCALVLFLVVRFVAAPFGIPSGSMEPLLRAGDRVVVNKLAYRFGGTPARGDVVVFDGRGSFVTPGDPDTADASGDTFVKRVIGVGGDRVVCCDAQGRITVDGVALDESGYLYPGDQPSAFHFSVVVPAGELFVLGDHRSVSRDSRDHLGDPGGGMVPVGKVIGRVSWIILPADRARRVHRPAAFAALDAALDAAQRQKGGHGGQQG